MKALDALEKAEALLKFKDQEIAARILLEAVTGELLAIKDLIIQEQDKLIKLLQGQKKSNSVWGRIKTILKIAEKAAMIAIGIMVGRGL